MLKKNKKITLLLSGLSGALLVSSAAGVALASCSTTSSSSSSTDVQYSYVIDWNNKDAVERLIIDGNGLVYSDNAMTTIIAVSPKVKLTTIKIPSRVKSIMGYSRVMYKSSTTGTLYDQIPSTSTSGETFTKVYQSYGAFQNMESLETVALESGSQLQSIGASAFSGCTTLKSISGLSNTLNYIGSLAFTNCTNLQAIDLSNVINIGAGAFAYCSSLKSVDLSKTIYLGGYAFQNCSSLTSVGSVEQIRTIGLYTFSGAFASGSNVTLKFSNLTSVPTSAFENTQGVSKIDFSGNTLLSYVDGGAFIGSSVVTVDFTGCSNLSQIRERAFKDCTSLTTVYLPASNATSLTMIGANAFLDCTSLTTVAPSGGSASGFVSTSKLSTIGANALANTAVTSVDLTNFAISSSTTPFGSSLSLAFITNLKEVKLPSTLTTLNAGLFYGSGLGTNGGFSLTLPNTITSIGYSATMDIATTPSNISATTSVANVTPFTNSGVTSVDMSKVTSYQTTTGSENVVTNYLFNGDTKLTSVVLKTGTTGIGDYAFQGTTALNYVTYPASSEADATAETTNGFTASSTLTTIGASAFVNAFSETSGATLDLSAMTFTVTPVAFTGSNIETLKLPKTVVQIAGGSFNSMPKLKTINFEELTNLTTITKPNFNKILATSIDLSNTQLKTFNSSGNLFKEIPNDAVVSLPNTVGNFTDVFIGTNGSPVTFSYPKGLKSDQYTVTSNVLTALSINTQQATNLSSVDFSGDTNLLSIGSNTFFGKEKLTSITLGAKGISAKSIFTANDAITTYNSANTTDVGGTNGTYALANVPFGNNEVFKTLNYTKFTAKENPTTDTNIRKALFNTTDATTWSEVTKIINSLSYQASATTEATAKASKANMSEWTGVAGATQVINTDAASNFTADTSVVLSNSYTGTTDTTTAGITINADTEKATILHNGVTWTYSNDGSTIKLTGAVNMYKAVNSTKSFLVFFSETTHSETGATTTTYYVPGTTSVNVTLTIATKASTN